MDKEYHSRYMKQERTNIAGKYRKMHIPDDPAYYEKFYFTDVYKRQDNNLNLYLFMSSYSVYPSILEGIPETHMQVDGIHGKGNCI